MSFPRDSLAIKRIGRRRRRKNWREKKVKKKKRKEEKKIAARAREREREREEREREREERGREREREERERERDEMVIHSPSILGGVDKKAKRKSELKSHLEKLNDTFLEWVKSRVGAEKSGLLSNGVREYLKHQEDLYVEYSDVVGQQNGKSNANGSSFKPQAFPSAGAFAVSGAVTTTPGFNFGSVGNDSNRLAGTADASPSPGTFKVEAKSTEATKPAAAAADGDEDKPLFEAKTKAYKRHKNDWKEMGIGLLSVVKPDEGKGKAFICFRSPATGKVLMRAGLYANLKVVVAKRVATLVLFPAKEKTPPMPNSGGSPPPQKEDDDKQVNPVKFSFRFGKDSTVSTFKAAVEDNV